MSCNENKPIHHWVRSIVFCYIDIFSIRISRSLQTNNAFIGYCYRIPKCDREDSSKSSSHLPESGHPSTLAGPSGLTSQGEKALWPRIPRYLLGFFKLFCLSFALRCSSKCSCFLTTPNLIHSSVKDAFFNFLFFHPWQGNKGLSL